ncbi:hypothetical protein FC89_GL002196 [Liquorilactobacillus ghanensis DSM 18630]|uniref:Uncharacterized protein n=1 Tax=Liquorilactobacillus ghanensis DSM 18630 TaxID=1423750 RepID=A0A0R1VGF2_9LACO|nr:hypothetical protein FC89_GL002196 [Liquorilactobacillus ghanensis DSM 18630]
MPYYSAQLSNRTSQQDHLQQSIVIVFHQPTTRLKQFFHLLFLLFFNYLLMNYQPKANKSQLFFSFL